MKTALFVASIPFLILAALVRIAADWVMDLIVPNRVQDWFSVFDSPYWRMYGGIIPVYKPYSKWDAGN